MMLLASLVWLTEATAVFASSGWTGPVVELAQGTYQGIYNESARVQYFLGIPYGADTTGENRWRAPKPPVVSAGLQIANGTGLAQCPSTVIPGTGFSQTTLDDLLDPSMYNEDCLFVNIFIPPGTDIASSSLPVFVDLHAGGYVTSGTSPPETSMYVLEQALGNSSIYVDISWRQGAFGFLAGPDVGSDGTYNVGLLDQQAALGWIQENIAQFGGDPDNVTLWGVSGGAGSVLQHIIANGGNTQPPLFNAAIASDPFTPAQYPASDPVPSGIYDTFVQMVGCGDSSEALNCLRTAPLEKLAEANYRMLATTTLGDYVFQPVVDGTFIVDRPSVLLALGKVNGHVLWAEHTVNSGLIFNGTSPASLTNFVPLTIGDNATAQAEWIAAKWPRYNASLIAQIQAIYNGKTFGDLQTATEYVYGENVFHCPSLWMVEAYSGRAYWSVFDFPPAPTHASTAYIVLGLGQIFGPAAITDYFGALTSFATSQSFPEIPQWTVFDAQDPSYIDLSTVDNQTVVSNTLKKIDPGLKERCEFWRSISAVTPQ